MNEYMYISATEYVAMVEEGTQIFGLIYVDTGIEKGFRIIMDAWEQDGDVVIGFMRDTECIAMPVPGHTPIYLF